MTFERSASGDSVKLNRGGAQVLIGPDPRFDGTACAITLKGAVSAPVTFGFDAAELAVLIGDLTDQYDRLLDRYALDGDAYHAALDAIIDREFDEYMSRQEPATPDIGKVETFVHEPNFNEPRVLQNRLVVPHLVSELRDMIDGLGDDDIVSLEIPLG